LVEFVNFAQLDDEATFIDIVIGHYKSAFNDFAEYADCEPVIDIELVRYAHKEYLQNISTFVLRLDSENPDQYKRAGSLLHALYQADAVTDVTFDGEKLGALEMNEQVGVSYGDVEYKIKAVEFYRTYTNEILEFDLAFRCCDAYEANKKQYSFDYLSNMAFYLKHNTSLSVQSFAMIFKSLMY
jgi:hypothetical protein